MNSEVKAKWLEALRSGEYKQARYRLRSLDNSFCCLGVLCDIYTKEVEGSWKYDKDQFSDAYEMIGGNGDYPVTSELPGCVRDWAEVEGCNPQVHVKKEDNNYKFDTLAELNDEGKTFNEIADLIEKQL
jgi:hypothetical protein